MIFLACRNGICLTKYEPHIGHLPIFLLKLPKVLFRAFFRSPATERKRGEKRKRGRKQGKRRETERERENDSERERAYASKREHA